MQQEHDTRRKLYRHPVEDAINIIDNNSGESIGTLVNITVEGLMVLNDKPMSSESIYQLTIKAPKPITCPNGTLFDSIEVAVDCLWINPTTENAVMYWSGCHIIDISDADVSKIEALITHFGKGQPPN